ncbi:hypothetical protein CY34DRAFT_283006 [Suillus luteus UH-Slu-Lm8-n1]|uniref:Uncharacterized protein n=1 Tax=Suillus luteus UH-Slu-Lm8-n1 TaxID=930992 RepID=A0A0D0AEQ1_9AGAM|nr:hypothetical protein CY34DRAFT_283006 [Suillus luteus UH-Slu-Lm8-n1]
MTLTSSPSSFLLRHLKGCVYVHLVENLIDKGVDTETSRLNVIILEGDPRPSSLCSSMSSRFTSSNCSSASTNRPILQCLPITLDLSLPVHFSSPSQHWQLEGPNLPIPHSKSLHILQVSTRLSKASRNDIKVSLHIEAPRRGLRHAILLIAQR